MIVFRDLPDIEGIELRYENRHRLMKDESKQLIKDIDRVSVAMFGITPEDTIYHHAAVLRPDIGLETWETHFDFLDYQYEEEDAFWEACGIDVTDGAGDYLECLEVLGRPMVCAIKGLLPEARPYFITGERSDNLIKFDAEEWGRRLLER